MAERRTQMLLVVPFVKLLLIMIAFAGFLAVAVAVVCSAGTFARSTTVVTISSKSTELLWKVMQLIDVYANDHNCYSYYD